MEENIKEILFDLVSRKQFRQLKEKLCDMNEFDIASFMEELDSEKQIIVFRMLPKELASDVFACLEVDTQGHIINGITDKELAYIIEELYVDDAVDMLEELPATVVKRVLQNAAPSTRLQINEFLKYPENSAGSIMTAEYIGLKKSMTVEEAFAYIRKHGYDKETIYTCYVMDAKRMLEGVVTVKDLLMSDYEVKMEDIMDTNVIKAVTTDDKEEIADLFNKYDLLSLPVVDHENRLVGIVTIDDAVDVMEEEATEDFEKMAAMHPSEKPYLKTGVFELAKNRIVWLLVLKVIWKEARVSVIVGIILGAVNFIRLVAQYPGQPLVALTVVLALFATVFVAKVIGGMLPIAAKKLHLDPAIMAAPLITTIVDAVSLVIYFQIAVELLHIK